MYKILLVDDEKIVLDSLLYIIQNDLDGLFTTYTAQSGRKAVEMCDVVRPDIVVMDIKMPGINGLEAIAKIKESYSEALFIVLTAYEKFDFAVGSLNMGVIEYITKPFNRTKIVSAIQNVVKIKDERRRKLEIELENKEKMAYILPILESGFIYAAILSDDHSNEIEIYQHLLDIKRNSGYIMTIEFGEKSNEAGLANKIGSGIKSQQYYAMLRDIIKASCDCVVGSIMLNRIVTFVSCDSTIPEYEQRGNALTTAALIYQKFTEKIDLDICIGIGKCYPSLNYLYQSYEESLAAVRHTAQSSIIHINDITYDGGISRSYPENDERLLLARISAGETEAGLILFDKLFESLRNEYGENPQELIASLTELVVVLSQVARTISTAEGRLSDGADDIRRFLSIDNCDELKGWLKNRIRFLSDKVSETKEYNLSGIIKSAKAYIQDNYCREITLEEVSKFVNISSNYFSKLFKIETGSNFIDYLTALRMEKAKKLLADSNSFNKEICYQVGYSDPNYFSRLFKKIVGVTPTEYKSFVVNR